jgi:hypothetical protein
MTKKSNRCTLVDSDHVDSDHIDSDDIRKNHGKVIDVDVGGGGDDAAASDDDDDDDNDDDKYNDYDDLKLMDDVFKELIGVFSLKDQHQ